MYYIYHIPGIKIGCSINPTRRVRNQGYTDFVILEEHTDILTASNRELELQREYGYKIDCVPYTQTMIVGEKAWNTIKSNENIKKAGSIGGKKAVENKLGIHSLTKEERSNITKQTRQVCRDRFSKATLVYTYPQLDFICEYYSVKEAGRQLNILPSGIRDVLSGRKKQTKGYTFKYK